MTLPKDAATNEAMIALMIKAAQSPRKYEFPSKALAESNRTKLYKTRRAIIENRPELMKQLGFEIIIQENKEKKTWGLTMQPRLWGLEQFLSEGEPLEEILKESEVSGIVGTDSDSDSELSESEKIYHSLVKKD